jgi:hypothetical protein
MSSLVAIGRWMNGSTIRLSTAVVRVQAALVFAAFALPLSSAPRLRDPLPLPGSVSVYASDLIVVLALASWPLARVCTSAERVRRLRTPVIGIPLALFALCLVPGILRGHERFGASLIGQPLRLVLYAGIAFALVSLTPRDAYRGLVAVFYAGAFWQAGLAVFSVATGRHPTSSYVLSTGGTRAVALSAAMFVSGALILALVNLDLDPVTRRRWLHLAVIPAAGFAIAASYGRTTFAALVLVLPALLLTLKGVRRSARRYWWAPALAVAAVAAAGPWIGPTLVDRLTSNPLHDTTVRWRVAAIEASLAGMRSGDWKPVSPLDLKRERLENAGFELGTQGWHVQGGSISTIPSNNPFFGRRSLHLVTRGDQPDEGLYSDPILTAVGQSWTFSIWLKGQAGGELVEVSIWSYGDGERPTGQANLPVTLSLTPTQYVVSTTITDRRTTHVRVLVRTRETAQAITAYGDDASLKSVRSITGPLGQQDQTMPVSGWVQQVLGGDGKPRDVGDAPVMTAGRNYLANPDFEEGTDAWSVQGGTLKAIPSNNPAFGRSSLEMRTAGTAVDEGLYTALVPARPGQTWVFSIWLKGFTNKERVNVAIWQYDRRGRSTTQSNSPFTLSTTPAQYFVTSTISSSTATHVRALVRTRESPQAITVDADSASLGLRALLEPAGAKPPVSGGPSNASKPNGDRAGGLRNGEPLIGLGFGRSLDYIWNGGVYRLDGDPHNSFVWLLAGGGALALGGFLVLLAAFVRDAWRRLRGASGVNHALVLWALAMWFVIMINSLTGPILSDPLLLLAVWVVMLLPALVRRDEKPPADGRV